MTSNFLHPTVDLKTFFAVSDAVLQRIIRHTRYILIPKYTSHTQSIDIMSIVFTVSHV